MAHKVTVVIEVEFEADNEGAVKSALLRIPNDLKTSLEYGKVPGIPTGVKDANVQIVKKSVDGK